MSEIRWIKIATDIFDDEKILLIESMPDADALIVVWLKLLVLAGKCNNSGVLMMDGVIPYTDEMLASIFRRPINTVRLALTTFEKFGMIEIVNDVITIPKWEKHQAIDKLEKLQQQNRERVRRHREKQRQLACNVTEPLPVMECNAVEQETDKDKELDICCSSKAVKSILSLMSENECEKLFNIYEDADLLIDEIDEELNRKDKFKEVKYPYKYIVGYATNKGWQTK